ncbi:MAG: hypothetical protein Q9187_002496 [Circinaria calcarea]
MPQLFQVQFLSYGQSQRPHPTDSNIIYRVDCSRLPPPPHHLCEVTTGLDVETAEAFWTRGTNNEYYHRVVGEINKALHVAWNEKNKVVIVAVFCMLGMHRSVAMADRLAKHFARFLGLSVLEPRHLDLAARIKRQRERVLKRERVRIVDGGEGEEGEVTKRVGNE